MSYSFTFNRPLSPHVLIYNLNWSLLRSILHRISGLILAFIFINLIYLNEVAVNFNTIFIGFIFWNYISHIFLILIKNFFFSFFSYHVISGLFHLYLNTIVNYDF